MVTTPPGPPEGLTIREASAVLRISPTTVRRRIKAGELPAREVPTTQGHEWRVFLDGGQLPTAGDQLPTDGERIVTAATREPLEGQYWASPEAIERAVERTGSKYVADVQALFDRVGALYEAQLVAKDQALAAQAGQLAAQGETIAELRRRAEVAEAARDRLTAAQAAQDAPGTSETAIVVQNDAPGMWRRFGRWWGR